MVLHAECIAVTKSYGEKGTHGAELAFGNWAAAKNREYFRFATHDSLVFRLMEVQHFELGNHYEISITPIPVPSET